MTILVFSANAFAQRKAVSAAKVTGTFELTSDKGKSSELKILALGKGHLQIELFTALKLGRDGDTRGNTADGVGTAMIDAVQFMQLLRKLMRAI